jgi:hypothetical protein
VLARIPLLVPLYIVLSALMVAWNVLLAGRIAQLRGAPRRFAAASALAGLLVAPAAIVAIAAASTVYGRALQPVAWVWPATTLLFVFQAIYATSRGLVTPFFGIPIVLYDIVIAAVALSKYIVLRGGTPPPYVLALAAAQANALGIVFGASALWKTYLQVPLLAPALPAHWRTTALARVVLGTIAIVVTGFVLVEVPDGLAAVRSYSRYAEERPQERPEGDFAIGIKILPELGAQPSAHALQNDTALVRLLGADVISVSLRPEGVRPAVLDSLSRSLDLIRTDETIIVVTLGYNDDARQQLQTSRERYLRARLRDVDILTRSLRPNIVIPAADPYGRGATTLGLQSFEFWQDYFTRTSQRIHGIRPATKVAYIASSYGVRDSTLYAWAATRGSPVDVLGFSLFPGFDGAATLDTRIRVAQRWLRQHGDPPKEHWVLAAGGFPGAHGERSQELSIWAVTAWATTQPAIKGLVVFEAGDYDAIRGLRAPDRRLRPAVNAVSRAKRGLREAAQ